MTKKIASAVYHHILDSPTFHRKLNRKPIKLLRNIDWEEIHHLAYRFIFYTILAVIIGVITGIFDAFFGRGLQLLNELRQQYPFYLIPFLGLAGLLLIFVISTFGGKAKRGMSLIFAVGYEEDDSIPLRMIPLTIFGTWLTHFFGGSAGREGVAVQIGATVAMAFARFLPTGEHHRILLLSGMAAGFGGLFGTPMAGTFFALEVLVVGSIFYEALVPALVAAWVASFTSNALGLHSMYMPMILVPQLTPQLLFLVIIAGLIFGLVGRTFSLFLMNLRLQFANWIPNPYWRIGLIGSVLAVFLLLCDGGRYSGLSEEIYLATFTNGTIYQWDWVLKLLFTVVTLAAGFQGGELTPCFVIGATLGCVLGGWLGVPPQLLAACGCAAVFGSATNTLLAPIFIGVEIFGTQVLPFFFIACVSSYVIGGQRSIYVAQKQLSQLIGYKIISRQGPAEEIAEEIIEVEEESKVDNKRKEE